MGPTPVSRYIFFFSTQLTEANIKKKNRTTNPGMEKEKEKEKEKKNNANPEKKKKKVKTWSKVAVVGPLCVFNYNIAIELWVMKTENSQKLFLVSITHNSKIK